MIRRKCLHGFGSGLAVCSAMGLLMLTVRDSLAQSILSIGESPVPRGEPISKVFKLPDTPPAAGRSDQSQALVREPNATIIGLESSNATNLIPDFVGRGKTKLLIVSNLPDSDGRWNGKASARIYDKASGRMIKDSTISGFHPESYLHPQAPDFMLAFDEEANVFYAIGPAGDAAPPALDNRALVRYSIDNDTRTVIPLLDAYKTGYFSLFGNGDGVLLAGEHGGIVEYRDGAFRNRLAFDRIRKLFDGASDFQIGNNLVRSNGQLLDIAGYGIILTDGKQIVACPANDAEPFAVDLESTAVISAIGHDKTLYVLACDAGDKPFLSKINLETHGAERAVVKGLPTGARMLSLGFDKEHHRLLLALTTDGKLAVLDEAGVTLKTIPFSGNLSYPEAYLFGID